IQRGLLRVSRLAGNRLASGHIATWRGGLSRRSGGWLTRLRPPSGPWRHPASVRGRIHRMLTIVRCGTLFDGTGGAPVEDAVIGIEDGRIVPVGHADTAPPGNASTTLDLRDKFVMPGLVDAHSHASIVPGDGDQSGQMRQPAVRQALRATANLRRDLAAGTTT